MRLGHEHVWRHKLLAEGTESAGVQPTGFPETVTRRMFFQVLKIEFTSYSKATVRQCKTCKTGGMFRNSQDRMIKSS